MQTFGTLIVAAFIASISASPLLPRADLCNTLPTGPTGGSAPIRSQPTAATAEVCQERCNADTGCLSFLFGLPASGTTPECQLFGVAASQIPPQSNTNLMLFDKACTGVPTSAPTRNGNGGNTNSPTGNPTGNPTVNPANEAPATQGDNRNGQKTGKTQKRQNSCGAAPAGPATNKQTPLRTVGTIQTQQACLDLCKTTNGCKSCEFGRASAQGPEQCILFKVAAANLPPVSGAQSFVVFDVGC